VKLVGISGSLQASSSNSALLGVARAVAGAGVEIEVFAALADVPAFNPDTEPAPPSIEAFRSLVRSADGLLIATPEYAFGLPGSLKNLLDWLVGSGELYGKPVVVLSAAPSAERGTNARADLERTLGAQGARVLDSTTIAVPSGVRGREVDDPQIRERVAEALASFAGEW
jgi:chromate reductase, NAD(P)H dehydrogenase (quinone)